ncbi:hypothetical protein B5F53_11795 [Blautia sp. An249]|uniref:hypothetical protein n=1 Tax=Blautia sp. An249 TaxID=1965603 RepID=UPI000B388F20|nr:hypothetical protein [Blautia sp. An249]OUO77891.1 hypothetical protein B5F53_11795 [Blautia sp. An249]
MSDGTVDNLNIKVSADAQRASRALDRLSSSLLGMDKAVNRLNTSGFSKLSTTLNGFSNSMSELKGIRIPDLSGAVKSLNELKNIKIESPDVKGLKSVFDSIKDIDGDSAIKTANSIKTVADSISMLEKTNLNDSGINKTANALSRLASVKIGSIKTWNLNSTLKQIQKIGELPDISNSVNRMVNSIARLANAGEKTGQSASGLANLGKQLKKTVRTFSGIRNIAPEVNSFISSIARLANAGGKTGSTASGLKNLAEETKQFFNVMKDAPEISENTLRMTEALSRLASVGGRVGSSANMVKNSFSKISSVGNIVQKSFNSVISIGNKAMSAMKKIASGISTAFSKIGTSSKGVKSAQFSLLSLAKTAIAFRAGYGLINFGKQAIELGSDITEVENVVDVSFGNMADKAYEFASTAKEQFGLSELAAKQYAGTMMAMLNSTGVAQDAAAEMSVNLAGLAGDLASFYNISTDDAFYKLRAAIAGETEPMRQLGINMTVAAMESYALSQGIDKSWQSMTQAEQALLRYNYILSVTGAQQGDFARTQNTYANQTRLLALNFQTLSATIGQGFIAAILPAIQALNALMSVLQRAAEAFRDFMYVLTGYDGGGSQSGVVNDLAGLGDASTGLENIGASGDDASDGLDDATDSAKELDKALSVMDFDELNQLSSAISDIGSSSSDAGDLGDLDDVSVPGVDMGTGNITDALGKSKLPDAVNEWAERIRKAFLDHDWDKLGEEIAWGINKGLQAIYDAINWKKVGPKITKFINAFTKTFNSLVEHIDWDLMGRTVGAGINTLVKSFNLLVGPGGIDFNQIGEKLSVGLRGAINEIEWTELGNALGNGFMVGWNILSGFVTDMSRKDDAGITGWESLGTALGKAVKGVIDRIDFETIAMTFSNGFNGIFSALKSFNAEKPFEGLGEKISSALNKAIHNLNAKEAGEAFNDFVFSILNELLYIAENTDWEEFGRKVGEFLGEIDWWGILTTVVDIIKETLGGLFTGMEEGSTAGKIASFLAKAFIAVKVANIGGISSLVFKMIEKLAGYFLEKAAISKLSSAIGGATDSALGEAATTVAGGTGMKALSSSILSLGGIFGGAAVLAWGATEAVKYFNKESVETAENTQKLADSLMDMKKSGEITAEQWEKLYTVITDGQASGEDAAEIFSDVADKMEDMGVSSDIAKEAIENAGGSFENLSTKASNAKEEINKTDFTPLISQLESTSTAIGDVEFSKLAIDAAQTIDSVGGIWQKGMDGWKQITGEKALEIYQGIQEGIYKDNGQGYYDIGNGVLVSLGQGLSEGTEGFRSTLDTSLMQTIRDKLPEGYTIAYENGKLTIDQYSAGITDGGDSLLTNLNNATIAKINEILPQGSTLAYNNGQWTIQQYAAGISGEEDGDTVGSALNKATIDKISEVLPKGVTISYNNGEATIKGYASGLQSDPTSITEAVKKAFVDGVDLERQLKEKYSGYAAFSVKGYTEKMEELKGETGDKMEDFAKNALMDPFANKLEINSPSKVFEGYGENVAQGLSNGIDAESDKPKNSIINIADSIMDHMNNAFDNLSRIFRDGEDSANRSASNIENAFSNLYIPLPHINWDWNYIGVGDWEIPIPDFSISWYKTGGLFTKATIAGIGEAGNEAVLPLENKRTMSMIADSILDNASSGSGLTKEEMKQAVAEGVAMAMMNQQQKPINLTIYSELRTEDNEVLARSVQKGFESLDYRMNPVASY